MWNKKQTMIFEQVCSIKLDDFSFIIMGDYFLFKERESDSELDENNLFAKFSVVKFKGDQVEFKKEIKI